MYHCDTMSVTAGMSRASKPPSRKRQVKKPPKEVQAAMLIEQTPHMRMLKEKKWTAGTLLIGIAIS